MNKFFTALFAGTLLLPATSIPIANAGFEAGTFPLVGNGLSSQIVAGSTIFGPGGTLDDWTASANTTGATAGGFIPSPGGNNWASTWWSGEVIGYLQLSQIGTVSLSQVLSTNLADNTVYSLDMLIGRRTFTPSFACTVQLIAGSTVLDSENCSSLSSNSSSTLNLTYSSGAANPLTGQALRINLSLTNATGSFHEAFFDDLSLTARSSDTTGGGIPEPSAALLLGGGLVAVAAWRRKTRITQ